ncbi:membrane protein [Paenibacillus sp. J31TS4]|uniref:EamA family transporter n=1 Tax=Paenibacillus sp. J31TS4 TaxID=2807195 RepID=UPI001B2CFF66|nr:EamA family transporter [Paenibacillus sp. J31TS4]GIP39733.1 membrane protein [Paenibacillus sp. J31TS4]
MIALLIVLANVVLLVTGQLLWKVTLNKYPLKSWDSILTILLQPSMIAGCVLFVLATLIWFYALSRYDLSRVYPLQSMAYVLGAVGGVLFFKETITMTQWLGMVIILVGVVVFAKA